MEFVKDYLVREWAWHWGTFIFGLVIFAVLNLAWPVMFILGWWLVGWFGADILFRFLDWRDRRPRVTEVHDDGMHVYEKEE